MLTIELGFFLTAIFLCAGLAAYLLERMSRFTFLKEMLLGKQQVCCVEWLVVELVAVLIVVLAVVLAGVVCWLCWGCCVGVLVVLGWLLVVSWLCCVVGCNNLSK